MSSSKQHNYEMTHTESPLEKHPDPEANLNKSGKYIKLGIFADIIDSMRSRAYIHVVNAFLSIFPSLLIQIYLKSFKSSDIIDSCYNSATNETIDLNECVKCNNDSLILKIDSSYYSLIFLLVFFFILIQFYLLFEHLNFWMLKFYCYNIQIKSPSFFSKLWGQIYFLSFFYLLFIAYIAFSIKYEGAQQESMVCDNVLIVYQPNTGKEMSQYRNYEWFSVFYDLLQALILIIILIHPFSKVWSSMGNVFEDIDLTIVMADDDKKKLLKHFSEVTMEVDYFSLISLMTELSLNKWWKQKWYLQLYSLMFLLCSGASSFALLVLLYEDDEVLEEEIIDKCLKYELIYLQEDKKRSTVSEQDFIDKCEKFLDKKYIKNDRKPRKISKFDGEKEKSECCSCGILTKIRKCCTKSICTCFCFCGVGKLVCENLRKLCFCFSCWFFYLINNYEIFKKKVKECCSGCC